MLCCRYAKCEHLQAHNCCCCLFLTCLVVPRAVKRHVGDLWPVMCKNICTSMGRKGCEENELGVVTSYTCAAFPEMISDSLLFQDILSNRDSLRRSRDSGLGASVDSTSSKLLFVRHLWKIIFKANCSL